MVADIGRSASLLPVECLDAAMGRSAAAWRNMRDYAGGAGAVKTYQNIVNVLKPSGPYLVHFGSIGSEGWGWLEMV